MPDTFTETTTTGWLDQIKNAIAGVLIGLVLFVVAFPALFINEGCYVKDMKALGELGLKTVSVSPDKVDPANQGKPVHMIGEAKTDETLADPDFAVSKNAIKLKRVAEMYQWKENEEKKTEKQTGGKTVTTTTYKYEKKWSDDLIESSSFKHPEDHQNPATMKFKSEEWKAANVTVGAFKLSETLISAINNFTDLKMEDKDLAALSAAVKAEAKIAEGRFYLGKDSASPAIGDIRVGFKVALPTTVSLIAQQQDNSFVKFLAQNGREIDRLDVGTHTKDQMIASAKSEAKIKTWLIRLGGFLAMLIGLTLIAKPLVAVANVLPFLGDLVGGGAFIFAAVIAFGLTFITISVAWVFYRPLVGIPLLVVGLGAVVGFIVMKKRGKAPAA